MRTKRVSRRLARLLTTGALPALALAVVPAHAAGLAARFEWSVPARFAVPGLQDPDGPYEVYVAGALHPASWTVDFDACSSSGSIVEYRWTIDGALVASESTCDGFSWSFASEGAYAVSLTVVGGAAAETTTTRDVVVEDLLIFGLGDSYGSGEGAPDQPVPPEAVDLANARQAAVDAATAARDAAASEYQAALSEYQITTAELDAVVAALDRYQDAKAAVAASCPLPVLACAQAQAELAAATTQLLGALAQAGLGALDIDQPGTILEAVADLRALAQAALDVALASLNAAQAALSQAQAELAAARAAARAEWQNRSCHRSSLSAQARAARLLEQRDPHTSVTFVHVACSGATVWEGVVGPYAGIEPVSPAHAPQVDVVAQLALIDPAEPQLGLRRPVDAVVLSIGGNDVNFADIIELCVGYASCPDAPVLDSAALAARIAYCAAAPLWAQDDCFDALEPPDLDAGLDGETLFRDGDPSKPDPNGLVQLPGSYAEVERRLAAAGLGSAPVHLTQYPDITRDENADLCGWRVGDDPATRQRNLLGISPDEMTWAATEVAVPLSDTMATSAALLGWDFVPGAAGRFRRHGYCSLQSWIVRIQESFLIEGQPWGAVHPNGVGYAVWSDVIATALPEPAAGVGLPAALAVVAALARASRPALRARGSSRRRSRRTGGSGRASSGRSS